MPKYILTYYNLKGRAQPIRLIFAAAGVDYEDRRLEKSDWPKIRNELELPNGQIPTLSVDGVIYCQTMSICRYLAEEYGLAGRTAMDKFRADMIAQSVNDCFTAITKFMQEKNPQIKEAFGKMLIEEFFPNACKQLETMLIRNNSGDGYFVGDSLTWADLVFFHFATGSLQMFYNAADFLRINYPKLNGLVEKIKKIPAIANCSSNYRTYISPKL